MSKLTRIELTSVEFIPRELQYGLLYVSKEFGAAVHLCACGCGSKVSTPLGPTEWSVHQTALGPTLRPSVGNWQLPCMSHYWITSGNIVWAEEWSHDQIVAGRNAEEELRRAYFNELGRQRGGVIGRTWRWLKALLKLE